MLFFFSSRRRHTRWNCDWSSDVCSSDLVDLHPGAGEELVEVLAREPSVRWEAPDLEVHVAVHGVSEPFGDEALDQRDHLGDVLGGLRLDVGWRDPDRRHVLAKGLDVALGEL